jgi:polysaccharide export outer membrane protein
MYRSAILIFLRVVLIGLGLLTGAVGFAQGQLESSLLGSGVPASLGSAATAAGALNAGALQTLMQGQQGQGATGAGAALGVDLTPGTRKPPIVNRPSSVPAPAQGSLQDVMIKNSLQDRTEFQDFILQATGRDLPIFGSDLFRQAPSTFAPVNNIPVTADYVIGPGDEIIIQAWGQIDVDFATFVDRNGAISVPRVGNLNVAGIKYQELTNFLRTAFSRNFRNFELSASLGRLRSMQIFVVGQARRPGTFTVSSLSTLVTALFAVGGPTSKGSMRNIQLKRGNRVVTTFDMYDLLAFGDKSHDAQLLGGDVIYIPPVGDLVAISGSVNVPAIFEIKPGSSLSDVLNLAGGLSATAQGQRVSVERIENRVSRKVEEFSLDASGLSRPLMNGDLVTFFAIAPRFENAITLRGSVAQPRRFPWKEGMRVKDIIPEKESLLSREYWLKRNQNVGIAANISGILAQQDLVGARLSISDLNQRLGEQDQADATVAENMRRLQIETEVAKFTDVKQAAISGQLSRLAEAVKNDPSRLESARMEALRLINQIRPPQKELNWDYALVERFNRSDLSTSLIPFNLEKAIVQGDVSNNLLLQPGDVITIFSKDDVQVSSTRQTKYIRVEGEFSSSGVYQIQPGETLRQLVQRIGGLTFNAYLFGAEFTRESTRVQQQKNLDEALNRLERDIQRFGVSRAQSVTSVEDSGALQAQAEAARALVVRMRQVRPTGRIVLAITENASAKDLPDLPLEDGDRLFVPPPPSMVHVFGSVYSENSFVYKPTNHLGDYLEQAGGPTRDADKSSLYVLRADGSVLSRRQGGWLFGSIDSTKLMPGDSIVVPEELDKTSIMRNLKDVAQIFYQFGLGAAALKVLRQ